ncbi:hypothetical protein [Mangrovitalea sediminis]|uniref:hypothetical protein n=1 Tax=Mangrovitalea sediminis TaxID=1982043 RepID=UPI000BE57F45|nr:hypothetical protein [Mangrovitalea sediminis]
MNPDPHTPEGMEEIRRRLAKRRAEAEEYRRRSEENVDEEPTGKWTQPNEIDLHRDRKNDD